MSSYLRPRLGVTFLDLFRELLECGNDSDADLDFAGVLGENIIWPALRVQLTSRSGFPIPKKKKNFKNVKPVWVWK